MAVALPERRERLDDAELVTHRLDDPLDPAAEVVVDLARLPSLGRAAERVADGRAGEAADGAAIEQVSRSLSVSPSVVAASSLARPAGE